MKGMRKGAVQKVLIRLFICLSFHLVFINCLIAKENNKTEQGLLATFEDGQTKRTQIVYLSELGLDNDESPHPDIQNSFTVNYRGLLKVDLSGTYQFRTLGQLFINKQLITGEINLKSGMHDIRLTYKHNKGDLRLGLLWKSEHFIEEPVPPNALWHLNTEKISSGLSKGKFSSPSHRIKQAFQTQKCITCHDQNFLWTIHHKYKPDALPNLMRHIGPIKRYGKKKGPIQKDNEILKQLAKDISKLPTPTRKVQLKNSDHSDALKMVSTKSGFACITCHGIKHHRSEAESKGPNLSIITERVNYDWFVRWMNNPGRLKPGVPMPAFFAAQKPEERQRNIDMLWNYMSQGQKMTLPKELKVDRNQFVLQPKKETMVHRVYMRLPDGREIVRAITIGMPNGVSLCFDAETCQIVSIWTDGYIDMKSHWRHKSNFPVLAKGTPFYSPNIKEGLYIGNDKPQFLGYEFIKGNPRFEIKYGNTLVHLSLDSSTKDNIQLQYSIAKRDENIQYITPSEKSNIIFKHSIGQNSQEKIIINNKNKVDFALIFTKRKQK